MLEEEGGFTRADVHIQPPPVSELTDEDRANEDDEVTYNNLSGRHLDQPASATVIRPEGRETVQSDQDTTTVSISSYYNYNNDNNNNNNDDNTDGNMPHTNIFKYIMKETYFL